MEKREEALREALKKNEDETEKWKNYKEENNTANENLDRFGKYLTVDVMVPIGQKALMPGQIIHTNEVLVGHYQGYFSKCSAHKAKEICEYRINKASEVLDMLKAESDLWQSKLEKPYTEGVLPNISDCEIIENYDEEKEKEWRENHKLRVKQAKMQDKYERELDVSTTSNESKAAMKDEELFKMLEKAELMEELENELNILGIEDVSNETVRKIMAGDLRLPKEKPRQANIPTDSKTIHDVEKITNNSKQGVYGIIKKTDLDNNYIRTNNNHRTNPELVKANSYDNDFIRDIEEQPQEIQMIKNQAKYLSALEQIGFYEYQIKIMRQKLLALPLITQNDLEQKVNILNNLDTLEEWLEIAEDNAEAEEEKQTINEDETVSEEVSEQGVKDNQAQKQENQHKRRISFALQDKTLEFRKNETVSQMLPKPQQSKDIIKLEHKALNSQAKVNKAYVKIEDRKQSILEKVESNVRYIRENQSTNDSKLVDKILESSVRDWNTLQIRFQHSNKPSKEEKKKSENFVPTSPADFYKFYLQNKENVENQKYAKDQTLFLDAYEGEDKVKVPLLREADRVQAYQDQRMEFCKASTEAKPILKKKSAVEREQHNLGRKTRAESGKVSKKNKRLSIDEEECMSAYYKVMNEVVEKPLTEPEPLPECKYINAHTPKKRVSRFKQIRGAIGKT